MTVMQRLDSQANDFNTTLERLLAWEGVSDAAVQATVNEVIARVRGEGDLAVVDFSNRFDRLQAAAMSDLSLSRERLRQAHDGLPEAERAALTAAAERIRRYHAH